MIGECSDFPDEAAAQLYRQFTRPLHPEFDSLLRDGILTGAKMTELIRDPYPLGHDAIVRLAARHIALLRQAARERRAPPPRVALVPAGAMFRELVAGCRFDGLELLGGFDADASRTRPFAGSEIRPLDDLTGLEVDHLIVLHEHLTREIVLQVASRIDPARTAVYCPAWDPTSAEGRARSAIAAIDELCRGESPVLLFCCIHPFAFLHKRLVALRRAGIRVVLVSLLGDVGNGLPIETFADATDFLYCADRNMLDFLRVLRHARPDAAYLYTTASSSKIPLLAARCLKAPYYVEYNDLLTTMYDREGLARAFGAEEAEMELRCERSLLQGSRGVVHKYRPRAADAMLRFHGISIPTLQFFPYPSRAPVPASRRSGPGIRIVFIGGISARDNPANLSTGQVYHVIDRLVGQGFGVDFYNAYDAGDSRDFDEFRQKSERIREFTYHAAVPPERLGERLRDYDVGWMVYDFREMAPRAEISHDVTSARFFDYLEAGLPIVVSSEFRYMAEMTRSNGLGWVIDFDDIDGLSDLLTPERVCELRANVARYAGRILMDQQIPRLIRFMGLGDRQDAPGRRLPAQRKAGRTGAFDAAR